MNILQASMLAMTRAVDALVATLPRAPDLVLVDGNRLPGWRYPGRAIVRGDALCLTIAAAAIVAKQARDAEMIALAARHGGYGWETNVGYGTPAHQAALRRLGPTEHHRRSFAPDPGRAGRRRRMRRLRKSPTPISWVILTTH